MRDNARTVEDVSLPHDTWQILLTHSVLGGLCPLLPIPFLDDYVIGRLQARMFTKLFASKGLELSPDGASLLLEKDSALLSQALTSIALYPIKKLLGKLLYFLTLKACSDVGSAMLHEGWILANVLEREHIPHRLLRAEDIRSLKAIRTATLDTCAEIDTSPIQNSWTVILRQSRTLGKGALDTLSSFFRRQDTDVEAAVEAGGLQGIVDALEEDASHMNSYFKRVEETFLSHLRRARAALRSTA